MTCVLQFNIIVLELYHGPEDFEKKHIIKFILLLLFLGSFHKIRSENNIITSFPVTTKFPKHHMEILWEYYNLKGFNLAHNSHMN